MLPTSALRLLKGGAGDPRVPLIRRRATLFYLAGELIVILNPSGSLIEKSRFPHG